MNTATMSLEAAVLDVLVETVPDESDLDYLLLAEAEWDLVADLDADDSEWDEADTDEFHAWLSSLEPSIEECEWRDCGFGHSA